MACEVSIKDIQNRLRNQIKDKFDSAQFYNYSDRLVAFVPYDALNPSKNVLYGKVKKVENQLNNEYGSSIYGPTVSFEQKDNGVEISIHPPTQLADAMTSQNIQDELGDDFYMGDNALREQEDFNFSKREFTNVKKPITDNYVEYNDYKKSQLAKVKATLKNLNREKRDPKKDASSILEQIKKLNIVEAKLKQDIEMLEQKEVELMCHALRSDIENINKSLDNVGKLNSNYDIEDTKGKIGFLYSFIKGVTLDGNEETGVESLAGFNHPDFDKISIGIDALNLKYKDKLSIMRDNLLNEDISYVNNIQNNNKISEEDLANMFNAQNDINWLEKTFLGITNASNNDTVLPQILKSFLETKVALREAEVKRYQDRLNALVTKLRPGGFDFIFEKTAKGNKTGNIINMISPQFKKALDSYYKIDAKEEATQEQKYKDKIAWLKTNTEVIDFRKLKEVQAQYGDIHEEHFQFSEEEMDRYEAHLRNTLGPLYEDEVQKVLNNLLVFQEQQATFLEDVDNKFKYRNVAKVNPWSFVSNYHSPNASKKIDYNAGVSTESVYSDIQNIRFVPKREVFVTINEIGDEVYRDSGYYNPDFNEIQQDADKLEYWKLMKEMYSDYINPVYGDKFMSDMSYAKFEETFLETLAATNNLQKGTKLLKSGMHNFKELFYEKGRDSQREGVIKDYSDNASKEVRNLSKVLMQKDISELRSIASQDNIDVKGIDNKEAIVREIALSKVVGGYSTDINKVTGALLDMVAIQKAKEDTLPIANLILDSHKMVKDSKGEDRKRSVERLENWIERVVKNQNEKYRGAGNFLGKDVAKDTWFGSMLNRLESIPFVGRYLNKRKAYLLTDNEKTMLKYLTELKERGHNKNEEDKFTVGDTLFQAKQTDAGLRYFQVTPDKKVTELTEEQYEASFQSNIEAKIQELGLDLNAAGFIQGILKMIIIKGLGLNPISGIFNRIEGKNSAIIMDKTGKYWSKGNIHEANNFMAFANFLKFLPERFTPKQLKRIQELKKFEILINNLNLIQDRKNELERQAEKSKFDYTSKLNLYQFAVDNPEFKNQGSILLSILMDTKIKDIDGNEVPVFNGKEFSIYDDVDGKLVLKDNFRTPENLSNWQNFDIDESNLANNQFLITRNKIKNAISRSQGNYDNLDVIDATKTIWGRAFTLFMKWMPEHFMQRFSSGQGVDLTTGKSKLKGRYRYLWENHPALFTTGIASLFVSFGATPLTLLAGAGFTGFVAYRYFKDTFGPNAINREINTAQEFVDFTKSIVVETLNYPLELLNSSKIIKNKSYSKSTLTEEEINNLQAIAKELGIKLTMISMLLLVKKLTWDDEDDKDSKKRQFHNFADNQLNRMVSALSNWTNPKALASDIQRLAFLKYLWDVGKVLESIATWDEKGKLMENTIKVSPLPRLLYKSTAPWLDDKEYENRQWIDRLIKNVNSDGEWESEQEYLKLRKEAREEMRDRYKNKGYTRDKLKKAVDKEMKQKFPKRKKGESYSSILERSKR